ncbi:MAG: hypothetical protein AMJ56_20800 [Anaerolineae bacterium SG8_19]|nr:MAG: hypothetical protein AMJ56_20800 [Anaerolineae bacterium SG8_19]
MKELESNLIGVTVIVLAVNFMGAIFVDRPADCRVRCVRRLAGLVGQDHQRSRENRRRPSVDFRR